VGNGPGSYEVYGAVARYITISGRALADRGDKALPNIDQLLEELIKAGDEVEPDQPKRTQSGERKPLSKLLETLLGASDNGKGNKCGGYDDRSAALFGFITNALREGVDEQRVIDACLDDSHKGHGIYQHCVENGGEQYIKAQIEHALNDREPATAANKRKIIRIKGGERHIAVNLTEKALVATKRPIYVRGGWLVEPLWRWEKTAEENRDTLVTKLLPLNRPRLSYMTAKWAVDYQRYNEKQEQWKSIDPPKDVMEMLLALGHWGFDSIKGISNAPIMRRNGSLFIGPGYDPQTQLWYKPPADLELPPIPNKPTREQAEAALQLIRELLAGFPFTKDDEGRAISEAVAIAGLMTPVLRGAFDHTPAYLFLAPEAGTGKTYLVTVIAMIATGRLPMAIVGCEDKEEMEKRLSAAAFAGSPITHLNNLSFNLESDLLNQ
jgi:hypothetical protein